MSIFNRQYLQDIESLESKKVYFIGILGTGMSALAKYLAAAGARVCGSDRGYHGSGRNKTANELEQYHIAVFYQNGNHVVEDIDCVVVSTAIEEDNLDIQQARALGLPIVHRSDILSWVFNAKRGIAVAGTSGKSTVTGMLGYILQHTCTVDMINGAVVRGIAPDGSDADILSNHAEYCVVEADESDGSIVKYKPEIGILLNISKDHKTIEELEGIFQQFIDNCRDRVIVNGDDRSMQSLLLPQDQAKTWGWNEHADYRLSAIEIGKHKGEFQINGRAFMVPVGGIHNIYNAAAAVAACFELGITYSGIRTALAGFRGIKNRLELIDIVHGTEFIRDFAHNPAKIEALLQYLNQVYENYLLIYQPHGFRPTFFTRAELEQVLKEKLAPTSRFVLLPIFYAGGTVEKVISSEDLHDSLCAEGVAAQVFPDREQAREYVVANFNHYGAVVVAGARDSTLSEFLQDIVTHAEKL